MKNEEETLPTFGRLIGEPGYRTIVWGERQLLEESAYESFEEVKEVADKFENFQYFELVMRKDVEALIRSIFKDAFRPSLKGEADELRNGADPEEVADMLEYYGNKFEQELLDEVQNDE